MRTVTIFIPALNEERHIAKVIKDIPLGEIKRLGFKPTVLVANGPSIDKTAEIARKHGAVVIDVPKGKGNSVRESFKFIKTDYTIMMDADETYPGVYTIPILKELEKGNDVVLGSRLKGKIEDGAMRSASKAGNYLITQFGNLLFGSNVSDICTGLWGFRKKVIKEIDIYASGFDIEANIFSEISKRGYKVSEIPIQYNKRGDQSKLNPVKDGMRIMWRLFDMKCLFDKKMVMRHVFTLASIIVLNALIYFFFFERGLNLSYSFKLLGIETTPLLFSTIVLAVTYLAMVYLTQGNLIASAVSSLVLIASSSFAFQFATIPLRDFTGFLLFIFTVYGLILTFGKENTQRYIFTLLPYALLFLASKELFLLLLIIFVFYFAIEHKSIASKKLVLFWMAASGIMLLLTSRLFGHDVTKINLRQTFVPLHFIVAMVGFNNAAFHKRKGILVILLSVLIGYAYIVPMLASTSFISPKIIEMMLIYTIILLTGIGFERIVFYAIEYLKKKEALPSFLFGGQYSK